jgi:hypothetical protein
VEVGRWGGRRGKGTQTRVVSGGGGGRGRGKGRLTGECAQPRFITGGEESWDFVSLGAALPSTDGRRNVILPALLLPFPRYLHLSPSNRPIGGAVWWFLRARGSCAWGKIRISGIWKPDVAVREIDRIDPGFPMWRAQIPVRLSRAVINEGSATS